MANVDVQPLALVHNNEIVYIERNERNIEKKFSCFKIFKLKGPIDINSLINVIFPPSEKSHYNLEVSDYNGQSANVKFNFTNRTHTDLLNHLQAAAAKFIDISENGLVDWIASDTITFKTIYQNTDAAAMEQLCNTPADNGAAATSFSSSLSSLSSSSSISSASSVSSPPSSSVNLQLYPIIDEEAIERELSELSNRISAKTFLTNYDLEKLFHKTFQRRDMTITIDDLYSEFFGQIRGVVGLLGKQVDTSKVIEDGLTLDPNTIIETCARFLFKQAESYISTGIMGGLAKDYKFGVVLTLWNLINAVHSIQVSYKVLLESDKAFKQILKSHKTELKDCLSLMDQVLMDVLILIYDELDGEKYERLQRRLVNFVDGAEKLMKLVMIINVKCNEQLEKLENQEKNLTSKLYTVAVTIGLSAIVIGGSYYFKNYKFKKYENMILTALTGTAGVVMIAGCSAKMSLQSTIQQQTCILDQLKSSYSKLDEWKNLGREYIEHDIVNMNNNRTTLIEKFVRVRLQCKCLDEYFDQF